jgi:hypothetical protein
MHLFQTRCQTTYVWCDAMIIHCWVTKKLQLCDNRVTLFYFRVAAKHVTQS